MGVFKTFTSEHKDFEDVSLQVYINTNNEIYLKIEDTDSSYPLGIILDIEDTKELINTLQNIVKSLENDLLIKTYKEYHRNWETYKGF